MHKGVLFVPVSEAQRKANKKYFSTHYSQVKLSMPNNEAQRLNDFCAVHSYTKAGFIRRAISEAIEREEMLAAGEIIKDENHVWISNGETYTIYYCKIK